MLRGFLSGSALARARDGDRMGGARGARRVAVRRASAFLRDHAALHRLRRPAAVHARPPAGRHGALLRLDQSRADAALRDPLAAADRRDGRGLLAQAADRRLDRDARRGRHHLGHGDRPDAGDEPRGCRQKIEPGPEDLRGGRVARRLAADLHGGRLLPAAHACRRAAAAAVSRARRGRGLLRGGEDAGAGGVRVVLGLGRDRAQVFRISRRRQQGASSPPSSPTRSSGRSGPRSPRPSSSSRSASRSSGCSARNSSTAIS